MTKNAFENAIRVDMALGGSTNTTLHIPAIAHDAGLGRHAGDVRRYQPSNADICSMIPGGRH